MKPTRLSRRYRRGSRLSRLASAEIFALVSSGLMNKQIAGELGLAEITVKIHRGHITKKMGAKSLAELVRMAETLGIPHIKP